MTSKAGLAAGVPRGAMRTRVDAAVAVGRPWTQVTSSARRAPRSGCRAPSLERPVDRRRGQRDVERHAVVVRRRAPSGRCRSCCRRRRRRWCGRCRRCTMSTSPRCIRWPPALSAIDGVRHAVLARAPTRSAPRPGCAAASRRPRRGPGCPRRAPRRSARCAVPQSTVASQPALQWVRTFTGRRACGGDARGSARSAVLADRAVDRDVLVADRGRARQAAAARSAAGSGFEDAAASGRAPSAG